MLLGKAPFYKCVSNSEYFKHINVLKILAITDIFIKRSSTWQYLSIYIYIDNIVAFTGLQNIVLKGLTNLLL